jgi:trans-2,3-dihydro-3-hydroxyanthranilate isomerase
VTRQVWLVDAFTDRPFGGNPAGVVPDASGLSAETMQSIAQEMHASETAFVLPPTQGVEADFRLRYFTPTSEVDLCGHATIGSVCGLFYHGKLPIGGEDGSCRIETSIGVLDVSFGLRSGQAWAEMGQAAPQFKEADISSDLAAKLLGIQPDDIDREFPLGLCFTGLWDLFVPVKSVAVTQRMKPDLTAIARWNQELGVASTHVYTAETAEIAHDFHARDFSPAVGIPEDPATGTATGALLALLYHHGLVDANRVYQFEQGYEISRPSVISARIRTDGDHPAVYVGGHAYCMLEGTLNL